MTLSEAKRLYSQGQQKLATGDFQGAIAKFKQALQFNPKSYLALAGLGDVMLKQKRYKEAIAHWHLSPAVLTTFVIKPGESALILITAPSTTECPESLQRLLKLEAWMKEWDDQYHDYRNKGKGNCST